MAALPSLPTEAPPLGGREPRWGLGDAFGGIVAAHVGGILWGSAAIAAFGLSTAEVDAQDMPSSAFFALQMGLWALLIAIPILVAAIKGNGVVKDFRLQASGLDIPMGFAIGVIAQLILVPLVSWPFLKLFNIDTDKLSESARSLADRADRPGAFLLLFVGAAIVAPFAEELMYRGLLLRAFEKRYGLRIAVVASSVVFAAIHFQALQFPALLAAGLVFGGLAARTGRLGPAIAAHIGFNATTIVTLVWLG